MEQEVQNDNTEASQVINAFEQILEVAPEDMFALEALHDAYLETGETEQAYKKLVQLAQLAQNSSDHDLMTRVADKLLFLETEYPEASDLSRELEDKAKSTLASKASSEKNTPTKSYLPHFERGIHQEIALAWNLYENQQISKEDYTNISNDITETSSRDVGVPVSVMHALQDRAVGNMENIIAFIARKGGAPLISLSSFEVQLDAVELLPLQFVTRAGAMPMDFIGEDLMVAILNPFNGEMRSNVEKASGRKCHFYLVTAPEYDHALQDLRKKRDEAQGSDE